MSHFSIIRITIKNPDLQLLKRAVEEIAKELNAEITNVIRDYYGTALNVPIGIRNNVFRRGIGVVINQRGVEVIGDFYDVPASEVEKFKQLLSQYYTTHAMITALTQLGYNVQTQKVNDKIYIRAFTF
jgi:hypothetical protein